MAKLVVVGGGAAGFFGAITAARHNPQLKVTILEAGKEFLSKVKISGGGRCNVTHHCFDPHELSQAYPRGQRELRGTFREFQPRDMIAWLQQEGVQLKTEADGRMFPSTDRSQTIIDTFLRAAANAHIHCRLNAAVRSIYKHETGKFILSLKNGDRLESDFVLLATGSHSSGHRIAASLGHHIDSPKPSLFTFAIKDPRLQDLAGVSIPDAKVSLKLNKKKKLEQRGPLLITHWGLSGPAVIKLSAWGAQLLAEHHYKMPLTVNWLPELTIDSIQDSLQTLKQIHPKKKVITLPFHELPKRLWRSLAQAASVAPGQTWAELSKKQLNCLTQELNQGVYQIQKRGIFKEEFVTCGGVSLKEVVMSTLESRHCKGLYYAGEVLNIDGITGGYNFQSAWTTAWLTGKAIAIASVSSQQ